MLDIPMILSIFVGFNLVLGECLIIYGRHKKKTIKAIQKNYNNK